MKKLEQLMENETDEHVVREIKYAVYLYNDLLTDKNRNLLDEYTNTLIDILKKKDDTDAADFVDYNFSDEVLRRFYDYLIKNRKTKKTAYDYVKRIERICKEYGITPEELFNKKSGYSINDLIGMYSKNGVKSDENRKCHNAPSSALKQFRDFMFND